MKRKKRKYRKKLRIWETMTEFLRNIFFSTLLVYILFCATMANFRVEVGVENKAQSTMEKIKDFAIDKLTQIALGR